MSIILSTEELKKKMYDDNIAIIDVRTKSQGFETGEAAYEHGHLPGAFYLDFKKDLTGENTFMPDPDKLAEKLGEMGITNDTEIVLYDQGNHRAASKGWAVLHYIDHDKAYILNGGFPAWVEAGNEITSDIPTSTPATYKAHPRESIVVDIDQVKERLEKEQSILIDSRAHERYTGEVEPKYKKAGHIPGARNYHSKQIFNDKGAWKSKVELKEYFGNLNPKEEIMVSCGSGNSSCMNLVALKEAGFEDVKLYPGGFSEWIEDDENEVKQGGEN